MNFKEFIALEAVYKGNVGMMEMFKFHQVATPAQKDEMRKLLAAGKQSEAWELLKTVTGAKLRNEAKQQKKWIPKRVPDGYAEGKWTWAVVEPRGDGDEIVIDSGFSTKRDAQDWINRSLPQE